MANRKQKAFVEEYLRTWNATNAAIFAGYSPRTARQQGSRLLSNANIAAEITARLAELQVSSDEALTILAEHARGDMGEFLDITTAGFILDLLNEDGTRKNTKLIRKIKQKVTTFLGKNASDEDREIIETEIELYDAQAAVDKILRVAGKYKDTLDVNVNDPISIIIDK